MVCFWGKKSGNPGDSMKKLGLRRSEGRWDRYGEEKFWNYFLIYPEMDFTIEISIPKFFITLMNISRFLKKLNVNDQMAQQFYS